MSNKKDEMHGLINNNELNESLKNNPNLIFDQYKLYVEMANDISNRRENANKFYLTLISTILGINLGILKIVGKNLFLIFPILFCTILCFLWIFHVNEYNKLNEGKFKIINYIENFLPFKGFTIEWELIKPEYTEISSKEKLIPKIIILFSILLIIYLIYDFLK